MPKSKICIKNLTISDIPSRSNRIFLKLKSGHNSVLSNKYQIGINNKVAFEDIIVIEHEFEKSKKGKTGKLRFSFRIEKSNGTDFKRYGSFNITDLDYKKLQPRVYHISRNLEKCKEKPIVSCDIILLDITKKVETDVHTRVSFSNQICLAGNHKRAESSAPFIKSVSQAKNSYKPHFSDLSANSDPIRKNMPMFLCVDEDGTTCSISSFSMQSSSNLKSIPLKISQEKYEELEKSIEGLLADIINRNIQD